MSIKMKNTFYFVVPILVIALGAMALFAKDSVPDPETLSLGIGANGDNPVIMDIWLNDRLFESSRLIKTTVLMPYPKNRKNGNRFKVRVDWIEMVTKKAFRTEYEIDPAGFVNQSNEVNVFKANIKLGKNGEVTVTTGFLDSANGKKEVAHYCADSYGEGNALLEDFKTPSNETYGPILDSDIEMSIDAIQYSDPTGQVCE